MVIDQDMHGASESEQRRLLRLCASLTGSPDVAEDLVQETMIEAWRHHGDLRHPERRMQWLFGIARNVCLRWLRRHGRELRRLDRASVDGYADELDAGIDLDVECVVLVLDAAAGLYLVAGVAAWLLVP